MISVGGWAFVLAALVMSWPMWTVLHELSHVLVAKLLAPVKRVDWWLYPHRDENGNFFFARVSWQWVDDPSLTNRDKIMLYSAPRIMNVVAAIMLPFSCAFSSPWSYVWFIVWVAGLIDLFVGSLGISEASDLKNSAKVAGISPWIFRVVGMLVALMSVIIGIILLVLQ